MAEGLIPGGHYWMNMGCPSPTDNRSDAPNPVRAAVPSAVAPPAVAPPSVVDPPAAARPAAGPAGRPGRR